MRPQGKSNTAKLNTLKLILFLAMLLAPLTNITAKDDPNDCSYKPIFGLRIAQAKKDWGIEFEGNSRDGINPKTFYFPIYGHWCGPNYPRAGEDPAPFDTLDGFCRVHDICYAEKGYSDCSCDRALISSIQRAKREGKRMVRCRKNGKKIKMVNPSYEQVEWHFTKEMDKRNCPRL